MNQSGLGWTFVFAAVALLCCPAAAPHRRIRPIRSGPSARRVVPARTRRALVVGAGAAAAIALLWPAWSAIGLVLGLASGVVMSRAPIRLSAAERTRHRDEIAIYCGLLANCLDAGMPVSSAMSAVGQALWGAAADGRVEGASPSRGPASILQSIAALLGLGARAEIAWAAADDNSDLAPLAAAARRSEFGGIKFAGAVRDHAARLRTTVAAEQESRSGRAGVLIAAPLGLCFLPAFICLGLAPVVIGLLGNLGL